MKIGPTKAYVREIRKENSKKVKELFQLIKKNTCRKWYFPLTNVPYKNIKQRFGEQLT